MAGGTRERSGAVEEESARERDGAAAIPAFRNVSKTARLSEQNEQIPFVCNVMPHDEHLSLSCEDHSCGKDPVEPLELLDAGLCDVFFLFACVWDVAAGFD